MTTKASAVVLSYARPLNIPPIVERLLEQPFVDDVIVWHQGEPEPVRHIGDTLFHGPSVRLFCESNQYTWGRFLGMGKCKHDVIITQDDDVLLHNWPEVWSSFSEDQKRISCAMPFGHERYHSTPRCKTDRFHEVLLGWGSAFSRRQAEQAMRRYDASRGANDELLRRKADRILSALWGCEHKIIRADFDELPGARDDTALWRQPEHSELNRHARQRVKEILDAEDAAR